MELVWFVPRIEKNKGRYDDEIGKVYPYLDLATHAWCKKAIVPSNDIEAFRFAAHTRYAPVSDELYQALSMAGEWINNIIEAIGTDQAIDAMPNNCGGRLQIKRALENAKRSDLLGKS